MATEPTRSSEGTKKQGSKTSNRTILTIVMVVVLIVTAAVVGVYLLFSGGEETFEPEEVMTSLDEGACSESQAQFLTSQALEETDLEQKALTYEQAMNCYVQLEDYVSAQLAARAAEEAYFEIGFDIQAEQMKSAAEAHQLLIDYQNNEPAPAGEDENLDPGDVI